MKRVKLWGISVYQLRSRCLMWSSHKLLNELFALPIGMGNLEKYLPVLD